MLNDHLMRFQKLDIYKAALELVQKVDQAQISNAVLRDQALRASTSCFLQLCEGLPNEGAGLRHKYFTQANNSLHETVAAIDLARALKAVSPQTALPIQQLGIRVKSMPRPLMHPVHKP